MASRVRIAIRVEGVVQGVGFRPFVYSLATRLGLAGWVGNDVDGVFAEVEGPAEVVGDFLAALRRDAPPLATVDRVTTQPVAPGGAAGFSIVASDTSGQRHALVSADTATCADCLRELADPADRRFGYPFINCTNCGPRFTIVRGVPYDRPLTTMAGFPMCAECAAEYHDPADRRFHAQPVCCPACGPRLRLLDPAGARLPDEPLAGAAAALRAGQVLAVKGLGGYHLAVDAASEPAAALLRSRKHREDKPFAVMVADTAAARLLCEVDELAESLLTSRQRPIVLLLRDATGRVAASVAPGNGQLGVMLPYTPLHHLLLREFAGPIVLTSGNVSDEPIAYTDEDALGRLGDIADAFLTHDRAIHMRTDDSVLRPFRGRPALLRRSRGFAPEPLTVRHRFPRPVLACGAELKNTFCLGSEDRAFLSQHIGDLENYETLRSFADGIGHFQRLFGITPEVVAYDLHPEYLSTKYALDLDGVELTGVQHHHAHIASCLADNDADGPVIGVAFDGTGYGTDATIWGGEFLIAELAGFERAGQLAGVPMPGGAAAIRQPWRMAAAYLDAAFPGGLPDDLQVAARHQDSWADVTAMARRRINAPVTSSAGRLFDAVASLLGVRDTVNYEGQAAIELEQRASPRSASPHSPAGQPRAASPHSPTSPSPSPSSPSLSPSPTSPSLSPSPTSPSLSPTSYRATSPSPTSYRATSPSPTSYRATISGGGTLQVHGADLVRAAAEDLLAGEAPGIIAARFHDGVADMIGQACLLLRDRSGLGTVALSGGVFQNLLLLGSTVDLLAGMGFQVLVHSRVPPNDGGISLGQAMVAAARDRARPA